MAAPTNRLLAVQRRVATESIGGMNYSAFCKAIDVKLSACQQAIARIAYDHEPPRDAEEQAIAEQVFGGRITEDMWARHWVVFVAICGARAGKSYTLEALRILHLALTIQLDGPSIKLAPGEIPIGLIVAPDERLAMQTMRYVTGALKHPRLAACKIDEPGQKRAVFKRPHDGRIVAVECLPATGGGTAVRARSLFAACMEEAAFFFSEGHVVNDDDIYDAIRPRLIHGAQLMVCSTPWLRKGLLYRMWETNTGAPTTALAVRASTTMMRPEMSGLVEELRKQNPDNVAREYDAIALSAGAGVFLDPAALKMATDGSCESFVPEPGDEVIAAADFGFRVNASTLIVGYRRGDITYIVEVIEIRPEPDLPLVPSDVVDTFAEVLAKHHCTVVLTDAHGHEKVQGYANDKGISLMFVSTSDKTKHHLAAKVALAQKQVRLPDHGRLNKQLREIISTPVGGGGITIKSPQWKTGEHGDLASACVLVIAAPGGEELVRTVDMSDAQERIRRDMRDHWAQEQERIRSEQFDRDAEAGLGAWDPDAFARIV